MKLAGGMRYKKDVLGIKYQGQNIFDVLEMSISDALGFFEGHANITSRLQVMEDVGSGLPASGSKRNYAFRR